MEWSGTWDEYVALLERSAEDGLGEPIGSVVVTNEDGSQTNLIAFRRWSDRSLENLTAGSRP